MKGLTKYASDYAETSYDNFLNRYYQKLNPYLSTAGMSLIPATQAGTQYAKRNRKYARDMGNIQAQE